jgi:hypothetical protein
MAPYEKLAILNQESCIYHPQYCCFWMTKRSEICSCAHSRCQQRTDQMVLVLTLKLLPLKKLGFSPVKNTYQNFFYFFLPLFYATFQCRPYTIFKKYVNLFFAHENIKKRPQKLLIIGPKLFFHSTGPAAQTSPEFIFHIIKNVPRLMSPYLWLCCVA